jgi:hypothetical protein
MATSTVQHASDMASKSLKKTRAVKSKAKAGRPFGTKNRTKNGESMSAQLYRQGKDAVAGVYETAAKASRAMPKIPSTRELRQQGQSVYSMMEERPLVMGAVGLGVGIALAALLPSLKHSGKQSDRQR